MHLPLTLTSYNHQNEVIERAHTQTGSFGLEEHSFRHQ